MKDELSIATLLDLQAYCVDYDLQFSGMLEKTRSQYDEKVRIGRTEANYNDWLKVKLMIMRADKEA